MKVGRKMEGGEGREGGKEVKQREELGEGKMEHNVVSLHSAPVKWSTLSLSYKHTLSHLHKTVCVRTYVHAVLAHHSQLCS